MDKESGCQHGVAAQPLRSDQEKPPEGQRGHAGKAAVSQSLIQ